MFKTSSVPVPVNFRLKQSFLSKSFLSDQHMSLNFSYLMQNDEMLESMGLLKDIQEIMNSLDQNDLKII